MNRKSFSFVSLLTTLVAASCVERFFLFTSGDTRFLFCSAFASIGNANTGSNVVDNTGNSIKYNNGIPDPPPPVLLAKNKRLVQHRDINAPIPITLLSGFLGCGKTTLLQSILHNSDGLRIAVIVNDVASINIDGKLLRSSASSSSSSAAAASITTPTAAAAGIIELQNGCACCSKSDELLLSIADMVTLNDMKHEDEQFDHIVIELSGIANPLNIRNIFHDAMLYQMPLLDRVVLDTMVTVVDCSTVMDYINSPATANRIESPELFDTTQRDPISEATDDLISLFDGSWQSNNKNYNNDDDDGTNEGVAELIVSQIETSDIIIMNKIDLLRSSSNNYSNTNEGQDSQENQDNKLDIITDLLYKLNPRANHIPSVYANVPITTVLGAAKGQGVALAGILDDHKDAVQFASSSSTTMLSTSTSSSTPAAAAAATTSSPTGNNNHHDDHFHDDVKTEVQKTTIDPVCADPTHSHDHSHHHHETSKLEVGGEQDDANSCNDPVCTDPTHSHDHHHQHDATSGASSSTTTQHAGIGSFVYRSRRPFHPQRLHAFLQYLPIQRGLPPQQHDDDVDDFMIPTSTQGVIKRIIRSKGFVWCANSNIAALYISQAGTNFDISCLGSWWATLPRSQWPSEAIDTVLQDFDSIDHLEPSVDDDTISSSVGDRRQELVFIGNLLGTNASYQNDVVGALDQCTLNDTEYALYRRSKNDEEALSKLFPSTLPIKQISY